jgi:mRNA interferase RelE/StbE
MQLEPTNHFKKAYKMAPERVRKDFKKQGAYLLEDLRHPSLHAKKYDEKRNIWQARVNRDWRFYFVIYGDTYHLIDIMAHPK